MHLARRLATFPLVAGVLVGCATHAPLPSGAISTPTDDNVVSFETGLIHLPHCYTRDD